MTKKQLVRPSWDEGLNFMYATFMCCFCGKRIDISDAPSGPLADVPLSPPWRRFEYTSKKHPWLKFRPVANACSDSCELAYRREWAAEERVEGAN